MTSPQIRFSPQSGVALATALALSFLAPIAPLSAASSTDADLAQAHADALGRLRTDGLLLVPEITNKRVMAFDPITGELIDANFIPPDPAHLVNPIEAIVGPNGTTLLISDLAADVVFEYDLATGAYLRIFAPAGGVNNAILDNVRGIAMNGRELLVTNAGGANADAVARFDADGIYLGNFIANGSAGLDSPWDIIPVKVTDGDLTAGQWLVSANVSDFIHHYSADGSPLANFTAIDNSPFQIEQHEDGGLVVANFSGSSAGILLVSSSGSHVVLHYPLGTSGYHGAHLLPDGHYLITTTDGVYEYDPPGGTTEVKVSGVNAFFVSLISPWNPSTPLPETAARADLEQVGGKLYLLGYLHGSVADGSIWALDLATNVWSDTGVDLPVPVIDYQIARLEDATGTGLYLFGGHLADGNCTGTVQAFYPATLTTATFPADPWPAMVSGVRVPPGAVAVAANRAFGWGGICPTPSGANTSLQTWIFDPMAAAGARWSAGPQLPTQGVHQAGVAVDGKIFSIGGNTFEDDILTPSNVVLRLDPANLPSGWQPRAALPMPTSGIAGCGESTAFGFDTASPWELHGKIVLTGCGQWPNSVPDSFLYDVARNTWLPFPALGQSRRRHAGALVSTDPAGARLWIGGGYVPGGPDLPTAGSETVLVGPANVFADGFEGGTTGAWSAAVP